MGDWSPDKDCCLGLMFRQSVRKPSSESRLWTRRTLELSSWEIKSTQFIGSEPLLMACGGCKPKEASFKKHRANMIKMKAFSVYFDELTGTISLPKLVF